MGTSDGGGGHERPLPSGDRASPVALGAPPATPMSAPWPSVPFATGRPGYRDDLAGAASSRASAALERSTVRALAALRSAGLVLTPVYLAVWNSWYAHEAAAVAVVVAASAWGVLFVVVSLRHGVGVPLAAGTVVAAAAPAALSSVCLPPASAGDTGSWVMLAVFHAGLTAAWALPPRAFAAAETVLVVSVVVGGHDGRPQVFTAVTFTLVVPVLFALAACRLRESTRRADDRLTSAMLGHRARVLVLALDRDRRERQRLLHDTVLNILTGIAWGGGDDLALARRRCAAGAAAVRHLLAHDHGPPAIGLDAALAAVVSSTRERGLTVHLTGTAPLEHGQPADGQPADGQPADGHPAAGEEAGGPSAAVVAALAGATGEALANVERHAGTGEAWVCLERSPRRLTIRVSDRGAGFQPGRFAPDRLGVRQSVLARVRDAGGLATIDSAPGRGTTVTLTWPDHGANADPRPAADNSAGSASGSRAGAETTRETTAADLRYDYAAGLRVVIAALAIAWQVLMLLPLLVTLGRVHSAATAVGVWLVLAAATVTVASVVRRRPLSGPEAAGVTALAIGAVLASANVDDGDLLRVVNWPLIAVGLLVAFVTASRRAVESLAAMAVVVAAVVATVVVRGVTDPLTVSRLLSLAYGITGLQLIVAMMGPLLRRTADTTARAVRAEAETAAGRDSDVMIRRERARWLGAIRDDVLPTLDALADGTADPRDRRWRRQCARQAAAIRRMLVQGGSPSTLAMLAADIEAVVAAAEGRGMTVEVQVAGEPANIPLELRAGLVDLLDRTLAVLPENRALLTLWSDAEGGSVFVSAAWPGQTEPPALTGAVQAIVDVDDGRITVELRWDTRGPEGAGRRPADAE
ncbi:ATP-binding protein [Frankia sp. Mgl5]|uniref:sensor histidine kinase n=1 Tax=Frankia sp. Mgl5 TaxID=2933793 RepID=UPI00200F3AA3|nr:sensor histidine kinase [Frankia sp. Mgl5]MCK9926488.1 ATP-binding protein [Frankia sp. Mgl5]